MTSRDGVSPSRGVLSGRGGAGNFGKDKRNEIKPEDLATPTIKSDHYTTGRGGSGNIAKNDSAAEARMAQDVEATVHHETGDTAFHYGRGGAANVAKVPKETLVGQDAPRRSSREGLAEKSKDFLDKIVHGHGSKH